MAKIVLVIAFSCMIGAAFAASALDSRDILGNFYDGTTGQISSSLTGRVYSTRPTGWGPVVGAPVVGSAPLLAAPAYTAAYAAPAVAAYSPYAAAALHAPLVHGYGAPLIAPGYASAYTNSHYLLKK